MYLFQLVSLYTHVAGHDVYELYHVEREREGAEEQRRGRIGESRRAKSHRLPFLKY